MNPYLADAAEEIKRVDHLVTVSLKYTRTVDVIKSVIERVISAFDCIMTAIIEDLKEKKKITSPPASPGLRVGLLQKTLKDNGELQQYLELYTLFRKISRAEYGKREEYRRHVTMIANLDDGSTIDVDIDLLVEYYAKTMDFLKHAKSLIEGKKNE